MGKFEKQCGCILHVDSDNYSIKKVSSVNRQKKIQRTQKRNLIKPTAKNICSICLDKGESSANIRISEEEDFAEQGPREEPLTDSERLKQIKDMTALLDNVQWRFLSLEEQKALCDLASILGNLINLDLYHEGLKIAKLYKDVDSLKNFTNNFFLEQSNPLLVSFLQNATTNVHTSLENTKKKNTLTHAVEQTYYARNLNTVSPFSFIRNYVTYNLTHSKLAVQLLGNWEGAGSYTTLIDLIMSPSPRLVCPTEMDVINSIDNNQKVRLRHFFF